jgi:hypothetical protein
VSAVGGHELLAFLKAEETRQQFMTAAMGILMLFIQKVGLSRARMASVKKQLSLLLVRKRECTVLFMVAVELFIHASWEHHGLSSSRAIFHFLTVFTMHSLPFVVLVIYS